eukprot:4965599-Prymnesium_polylepis.1
MSGSGCFCCTLQERLSWGALALLVLRGWDHQCAQRPPRGGPQHKARGTEVVPTHAKAQARGGCWGGCLDTLIIIYSLGTSVSPGDLLRGFDREVMSEVDRELMDLDRVSRVCSDGLGRKWNI